MAAMPHKSSGEFDMAKAADLREAVELALPELVIHDPANGIFDWTGENTRHGEFRVTTVGRYLITYFQPHEAGTRGSVQVHHGHEILHAWTANAREVAEHFAEMVAKDSNNSVMLTIPSIWSGARRA